MYERQHVEKPKENVWLLLITCGNKVMVEPSKSSKKEGKVVAKPLSKGFQKIVNTQEAFSSLVDKYNLHGIHTIEDIDVVGSFSIGKTQFNVLKFEKDKRNKINLKGQFGLVRIDDILKDEQVDVGGTKGCMVMESLKLALAS